MGKLEKITERLLNPAIVMTFRELEYLMKKLGYIEKKTGRTSGSRKVYINEKTKHIIRIHKPHPGNEIKKYVKLYIIQELKNQKLL